MPVTICHEPAGGAAGTVSWLGLHHGQFGWRRLSLWWVPQIGAWLVVGANDEDAWRQARAANTQEAYEHYVSEWPSGAFVNHAKVNIATLKDEHAWREAMQQDTAEGYMLYGLDKSGKYAKQGARTPSRAGGGK